LFKNPYPISDRGKKFPTMEISYKFNHIDDFLIGSTANKYLGSTDLSKVEV